MEKEDKKSRKTFMSSFCKWIGSASFYIYINFFLSSWGDRMWTFSVGLYLVTLSKGHLRLAAIFGLCIGVSVLLFGGILGDWVDRNRRIKVVRAALFVQNFTVMLSAIAVCITLLYQEEIEKHWDGGLMMLCEATILTFAVIANLASVAHKIAIEKDWIVVVAGGKKSVLANLNAVIRAVDLGCLVLAPTVSGIIMKFASLVYSAIVLAGWNLVSVFLEYGLLYKVYTMVPELAVKGKKDKSKSKKVLDKEKQILAGDTETPGSNEDNDKKITEETALRDGTDKCNEEVKRKSVLQSTQSLKHEEKSFLRMIMKPIITFGKSWKVYSKQKVVYAGFSLSCLYMTVLGFDSITVGYIYTNGVNEVLAGVSMAVAGVTGILGTILFTILRPRIGLQKTGFIAFAIEVVCQAFCLISVFAPGSPFQPFYKHIPHVTCDVEQQTITPQQNIDILNITLLGNETKTHIVKRDLKLLKDHAMAFQSIMPSSFNNFGSLSKYGSDLQSHFLSKRDIHLNYTQILNTSVYDTTVPSTLTTTKTNEQLVTEVDKFTNMQSKPTEKNEPYPDVDSKENVTHCHDTKWKHEGLNISVILLLVGLVTSRAGLWMADLVITQLLQENVSELERGVVGGIQNSINQLMDLIKFGLVIFVPHIQTFGYLIMISILFMLISAGSFLYHAYRFKGYVCCKPKADNVKEKNVIYTKEVV